MLLTEAWIILFPPPGVEIPDLCHLPCLAFNVAAWDLNSDPQEWVASTLLTDLSPWDIFLMPPDIPNSHTAPWSHNLCPVPCTGSQSWGEAQSWGTVLACTSQAPCWHYTGWMQTLLTVRFCRAIFHSTSSQSWSIDCSWQAHHLFWLLSHTYWSTETGKGWLRGGWQDPPNPSNASTVQFSNCHNHILKKQLITNCYY